MRNTSRGSNAFVPCPPSSRPTSRAWTGGGPAPVGAPPPQFPAYGEGVDGGVPVVGEEVFGTEMHTDAIDYRYASRDAAEVSHEPVELEEATAARCRDLSRRLDLPLCGIDL